MANDLDVIDVTPPPSDEAEYGKLVLKLNEQFPPLPARAIDYSRLKGSRRIAKAIVLHLCTAAGWPPRDIADAVDLPVTKVYDLLYDAIGDNIQSSDLEAIRTFEILKLEALERKANDLLERGEHPTKKVTHSKTVMEGEDDSPDHIGEIIKTEVIPPQPNAAWGKLILEISKRRAALLGADSPTKMQVNKDVRQVQIKVIEVHNREQAMEGQKAIE